MSSGGPSCESSLSRASSASLSLPCRPVCFLGGGDGGLFEEEAGSLSGFSEFVGIAGGNEVSLAVDVDEPDMLGDLVAVGIAAIVQGRL